MGKHCLSQGTEHFQKVPLCMKQPFPIYGQQLMGSSLLQVGLPATQTESCAACPLTRLLLLLTVIAVGLHEAVCIYSLFLFIENIPYTVCVFTC